MFDRIFDFEKYVSELLKAVSNKWNYVEKNHIFFTYHTTSDKSFLVSPYSTVSTVVLYIVHDTRKFTNFATCAVQSMTRMNWQKKLYKF